MFQFVEPLQGSLILNKRLPRVARLRRLPWATMYNPFGVLALWQVFLIDHIRNY